MFPWLLGKKRAGLVLGGGVARGIAHIGVLKVLVRHKIPIHYLAGTSSGSIVGAAYAAGLDIRVIEEIALHISWTRILRIAFFRPGFVSGEAIEELVIKYLGDIEFADLKIPLRVVAADIKTGESVVLKQGRVARAVSASTAFPGVIAPVEIGHQFLVDGGLGDNLPVNIARKMGANLVIASNVVPSRPFTHLPHDPFQMYGRAFDLVMHKLSVDQQKAADVLIEPEIEEDIWHLDLHKAKRLVAAGEAAAEKALGRVKWRLGI